MLCLYAVDFIISYTGFLKSDLGERCRCNIPSCGLIIDMVPFYMHRPTHLTVMQFKEYHLQFSKIFLVQMLQNAINQKFMQNIFIFFFIFFFCVGHCLSSIQSSRFKNVKCICTFLGSTKEIICHLYAQRPS